MNYIRYNSLPGITNYVIDFNKDYYDYHGVDLSYDTPIGVDRAYLKPYESIFIKIDLLPHYVNGLVNLDKPFHLVTGCGDTEVDYQTVNLILSSPNLVSWTGTNMLQYDDRCLQVPIGIQETGRLRPNALINPVEIPKYKPIPIVVAPFSIPCNAGRQARTDLYDFTGKDILHISSMISFNEYMQLLGSSKYSCCPRGNGVDTHRVMESIIMGSIPIVISSYLDNMYLAMNCVIVDSWEQCRDISKLPERTLNPDEAQLDYWKIVIEEHQAAKERTHK